jgi:ribose/xylose/arabinose/galactoside ABC-type transport system permease subunit
MSVSVALVVGAVIGALDGVGIFFARDEPFKIEIFVAAILKGILVALLTGLSLTRSSAWWQGALFGLLYGVAFALVIFLAKGGFKSMDAPYVVPSGAILGTITGLVLVKFAFPKL